MTNQDAKAAFGYFLLLAAVVAFGIALAQAAYYLAVLLIVAGLLLWMIYVNLANVLLHRQTGAILILFGVLLAAAIFPAIGLEQDIFGGYRIKPDGATLSLIILFFALMPGLGFYYLHKPGAIQRPEAAPPTPPPQPARAAPEAPTAPPPVPAAPPYYYPDWEDYYQYYYDPELMATYYGGEYEEEEEEED